MQIYVFNVALSVAAEQMLQSAAENAKTCRREGVPPQVRD